MRDVEFLPGWYVERQSRALCRAAQRRLAAAALGCGTFMSAAVLALATASGPAVDPGTADAPSPPAALSHPAARFDRRPLASATARALDALNAAVPPGVDVTDIVVHSRAADRSLPTLTIEVRGFAGPEDLGTFIASLRRRPSFQLVDQHPATPSASGGGAEPFDLSLHIESIADRTAQ